MPVRNINLTEVEQNALLSGAIPESLLKKVKTAQKPRSARYGKNKGASAQKEVAQWIAYMLNVEWDNQDDNSPIQCRAMGLSGQDIILRGKAYEQFPFDVEVKAVETLSVPATIEQAKHNTKKGRNWLIYWKKKAFDRPVVIIDVDSFEKLFRGL